MNVDNRLKICSAPGGVYRWENLQKKLDFFENFEFKFSASPFALRGGRWGLARDDSRNISPALVCLEVLSSSDPRRLSFGKVKWVCALTRCKFSELLKSGTKFAQSFYVLSPAVEGEMFTVLTRQPCGAAGQYHSAGSEYDFVASRKNPSFSHRLFHPVPSK